MNLTPTPESQVIKADAKSAVAEVNPASPLVKPEWKQGTTLLSIAGICATVASQIPEIAELFPPESGARSKLLAFGVIAACVGSILAKFAGMQSAADVHAVRNLPPQ